MSAGCSSVDLRAGVVVLMDGQHVPIRNWFFPESIGDPLTTDCIGVVAGPDIYGKWHAVMVGDEDRELYQEPHERRAEILR